MFNLIHPFQRLLIYSFQVGHFGRTKANPALSTFGSKIPVAKQQFELPSNNL